MRVLYDPWFWVFFWSALALLAAVCLAPLVLLAMMLWKSHRRRVAWRIARRETGAAPSVIAREIARFGRSSDPGDRELVGKLTELQRTSTS